MDFEFFTLGTYTERDILKAGFKINSYSEINDYTETEVRQTTLIPNDYIKNNVIWKIITPPPNYERLCCLAKIPIKPPNVLFEYFINTNNRDEELGCLFVLSKKNQNDLINIIDNFDLFNINSKALNKKMEKFNEFLQEIGYSISDMLIRKIKGISGRQG